jgi:cell division inhibitor SulA/protein ImuA
MSAIDPVALRDVLARADVWRGSALAQGQAAGCPTGYVELDAALPGRGWPLGAMTEILVAAAGGRTLAGIGEVSLVLPALVRHTADRGYAALIAPPRRVHAPAWAAAGVELSRLIFVLPNQQARHDALWATEQGLRSGALGMVLVWLPRVEAASLKRLQRAAECGGACALVFRPAQCAGQSSPAPLRLLVSGSGAGACMVTVVKRRGPLLAAPIQVPVARPHCVMRRARAAEYAYPQHCAALCG